MMFNYSKILLRIPRLTTRQAQVALALIVSIWFTMTAAYGQEKPDQIEIPKLRALAIGFENELKELEILDSTLQSVGQLKLRKLGFSKAFTCPVVQGKLIFGIPAGVDEEGQPIFKPVATVEWKSSYNQVCLLFMPNSMIGQSQSDHEYSIQLMDMSSKFKPGHTKILNLTPLNTMVRLGEHQTTLKPWAKSEVKEVKELTGVKMAQLDVYYEYQGTIHSAKKTRHRYLDNHRYITLIYPDKIRKRVAATVINDFGNLY